MPENQIIETPVEASEAQPVTPPQPRVERVRKPGQMGYSDLRRRINELEAALAAAQNGEFDSRVAELGVRVERLQAEKDQLSARLASYDNAEAQLRQGAEEHLKKSLALFDARAVAVRGRFKDYDSTLERKPELRQDLLKAIVEMTSGPTALYFLIKAPELCRQLQNLPLGAALEQVFVFVQQTELSANVAETYAKVAARRS